MIGFIGMAVLASLADETPEGKSIVELGHAKAFSGKLTRNGVYKIYC
jgi:high-affinity K+ transport system ATPase subunit B